MINFYMRNVAQTLWHKILVLCFLFLALTLTTFAQGKKDASSGSKNRRTGEVKTSSSSGSTMEQLILRSGGATRAPRNSQEYYWDTNNNSWFLGAKHAYTYNAAGYMTEDLVTSETNVNLYKYVTAYDSRGKETEWLYYNWQNNSWVLSGGYKTAYTYTNNKLTGTVSQQYENGAWTNSWKDEYVYNAEGLLAEIIEYDFENNAYVQEERTVLGYTSGNNLPTSATYQELGKDGWESYEREINMVWNNPTTVDLTNWETWQLAGFTAQEWINGAWVNTDRETTTYSTNGSKVTIEEAWVNNAWVNDERETLTFDDKGNFILEQEEEWKNGAWVISFGYKNLNTYNTNNDLTETISQRWEPDFEGATVGTYKNQSRYIFSNFQNLLSAKEELELATQVYPNPATDKISIKLDQNTGGTVTVLSLAGQTMLTSALGTATGVQEINLSGLSAGTYLLQIQTKAGLRTKRIVKL